MSARRESGHAGPHELPFQLVTDNWGHLLTRVIADGVRCLDHDASARERLFARVVVKSPV